MEKEGSKSKLLFYLATIGSLLIMAVAFWSTIVPLHERWSKIDENYSQGYVVLLMCCWLIYVKFRDSVIKFKPSFTPYLFLLLLSALWIVAKVTNTQLIEQLVLPLIVWAWLAAIIGWRSAQKFYAPFLLIYLAIPLWDFLIEPLRHATVFVVQWGLGLLSIPAMIDGFFIHLPMGIIKVAGSCAGANYLMVAMVVGAANAYLSSGSTRSRIIIFSIAVLIGILANWARVFILVLVAYYSEMQNPLIYKHGPFGWIVFGFFILVYFYWTNLHVDPKKDIETNAISKSPAINIPFQKMSIVGLSAALFVSVLPVSIQWLSFSATNSGQEMLSALKSEPSFIFNAKKPFWQADYQGYDTVENVFTNVDGRDYELVALTYLNQGQGKELVYYKNILADEDSVNNLASVSFDDAEYNQAVVTATGGKRIVWWFYLVGGQDTTSGVKAKLLQLPALVTGNRSASLITVSVSCNAVDCVSEAARLNSVTAHQQLMGDLIHKLTATN